MDLAQIVLHHIYLKLTTNMPVGINPNHIEEIPLNGSTKSSFLVRAFEVIEQKNWKIIHITDEEILAQINQQDISWIGEFKVTINDEFAILQSSSIIAETADPDQNSKIVNEFIDGYNDLKNFSAEELDLKYKELKANFSRVETEELELPPLTVKDRINDFFAFFKPVEGYFITPVIVSLNIGVFILMAFTGVSIFSPSSESLLNWGANFRPLTLEGESWRLLTNCFLHIGILHLLMNMYALVYIGVLLEPYLGKARFIAAYLITGITASVASLWWNDLTVSAGASGAIFGMYGVFLAMLSTNLIEKTARKELLTSIAVFVAFNLMNGVRGGIDNAAHIGGLAGGLIIGYAFIPSLKQQENKNLKFGTIAVMAILMLSTSFVVYKRLPNDYAAYDQKFAAFAALEKEALEVYKLSKDSPKEELEKGFKEKGVGNWQKALKILGELDELNLPEVFHERNVLLKKYCELRINSYNLSYRALYENSEAYKEEMDNYNVQIQNILNDLKIK